MVMDSIMGNADRHVANVMVRERSDGTREALAVDNGITFEQYQATGGMHGSGLSMVGQYAGTQSTPHAKASLAHTQRVIRDLPDVSWDKWKSSVSDGTPSGDRMASDTFYRYRKAKDTGWPPPPGQYKRPPTWKPGEPTP